MKIVKEVKIVKDVRIVNELEIVKEQAPSYASPKLRLTYLLTGVRCRATSVAKKKKKEKK